MCPGRTWTLPVRHGPSTKARRRTAAARAASCGRSWSWRGCTRRREARDRAWGFAVSTMLTTRGWFFLLSVLALLLVALWTNAATVVMVCLTLLVWFLSVWLLFVVRLRLLHG